MSLSLRLAGGDELPAIVNGHVWVWGPYVGVKDDVEWARIAPLLYDRLPSVLPVRPRIVHGFCNVDRLGHTGVALRAVLDPSGLAEPRIKARS